MSDIVYPVGNNLYINLTNRCNNSCTFCIKFKNRKFEGKFDLWLDHEPTAQEVISAVGDPAKYGQIVFCGYGEPLIRFSVLKETAAELKKKGAVIRIDTDGQANLFHGRNILPELKGLVDEMNISLNSDKGDTYQKLCRSVFGEKAYEAVRSFARSAAANIPKVTLSVVALPGVDVEKCAKIAAEIGAEFRSRTYYEEDYIA